MAKIRFNNTKLTRSVGTTSVIIPPTITATLSKTLDNPNAYSTSAYDQFGQTVSISGNYAIVGAHYEDDAGGGQSDFWYWYYTR